MFAPWRVYQRVLMLSTLSMVGNGCLLGVVRSNLLFLKTAMFLLDQGQSLGRISVMKEY